MMEEWKEVKFGDICEFNPKETIKKGTLAKKISMDKITPKSKFIGSYELDAFSSGSKFRNDDILMARITPCLQNGKISKVTILEENEVAFGSTEFIVLRANHDIADFDFLYYLSICDFVKSKAIKSMSGTSGRQRVQNDILINTSISLPPLKTQKQISKILSSLDDKIELNKKINNTLEEMAQAIFKNWFVDFEPFKDGEFVESELGLIPKGWEVKELKEVSKNIICGKTPSTKDNTNFGVDIPFITIPDMHDKLYVTKTKRYLSKKGAENQKNKYIEPDSICVSCIATAGLVVLNSEISQTNQQINTIECTRDKVQYLYFRLKSLENFIKILGSSGSTTNNLNKEQFSKIKIIYPTEKNIMEFNNSVQGIFEKILVSQKEIQTLKNTRDTLLPKLMSGEISTQYIEVETQEDERDYIGFYYKFDKESLFDLTRMESFILFENDYFSDIELVKSEEENINNKILVYFKEDFKATRDNLSIYRDYAKSILVRFFIDAMLTIKKLYLHNLLLYPAECRIDNQTHLDIKADFFINFEAIIHDTKQTHNNIQDKIKNIKYDVKKSKVHDSYFELLLIENVVIRYFIMYSWLYEKCGNQEKTEKYIKSTNIFKENNGSSNRLMKQRKRKQKDKQNMVDETIFTYLRNSIVHNMGESILSENNEFDEEIAEHIGYLSKILLQKLSEETTK